MLLGLVLWLGGSPTEGPESGEHGQILYFGGRNPQAYAAATWEQFTGLGLAVGMMALFKRRFDRANEFSRWLALQYRSVPLDPISKIALLTASGLVASFAVADIVKRLPLFGRYF